MADRLKVVEENHEFFEYVAKHIDTSCKGEIVAATLSCNDWSEFWREMDRLTTEEELAELFGIEVDLNDDNHCPVVETIRIDFAEKYANEVLALYDRFLGERKIAILMEDGCTRYEAIQYLNNHTTVFDSVKEYEDSIRADSCFLDSLADDGITVEEHIAKVVAGTAADISCVEYYGNKCVVVYVL